MFPSVIDDLSYYLTIPEFQSVYICVGMPGSGKTTFYETYLKPTGKWKHVNRDTLKTKERCLKSMESHLSYGHSVIIDNTNPSCDDRKLYIEKCIHYRIPVMILHFVRDGHSANKHRSEPVPDIGYRMYFKKFQDPSIDHQKYGIPVIDIW